MSRKHRPKPRVRVVATQGNSDWFNLGERLITKLTTEGEYQESSSFI